MPVGSLPFNGLVAVAHSEKCYTLGMAKQPSKHTVISWKAPEFLHYKKSPWWFPVQALITLVLVALFILTKQYLPAIIVVLGAIIIYQLAHQEPEVLPVTFTSDGIRFKSHAFHFSQLKTFWIIESENVRNLYLQRVERFTAPVVIPLVKEDVEKVRDYLAHYLPETKEAREDFAERLNRWLKI